MTIVLTNHARELFAAPFTIPESRGRIGDALWLYVWLVSQANTAGHVCRTLSTLADDLHVAENVIDQWIDVLATAQLLEIHSSSPYLVLKLRFWPRSGSDNAVERAETPANEGSQSMQQTNVPVSGSKLPIDSKASKPIDRGVDRGLGEGEGLLAEAQAVLAVPDLAPLHELLGKHPPPRVRQALARVARTPREQIRKSRFALFRYLLATLPTNLHHDHDPPHQP